ncbi:AEC family transporter [uncultured Candidatus Puniceispirillum sp.]|uniref:AEC family transporter n=1 Tax=uncultured Candidatus Puniceispirillum sp. TaxID=1985115 RepID=UPI0032B17576
MSAMISTILSVLLLVVVGHLIKMRAFVPVSFWDALSKICYWILFPGLLFNLTSTASLSAEFILPFCLTLLIAATVMVIYGFLAGRLIGASGPATSSLIQAGLRHNGFLMLAFVQGAFGVAALEIGAIAVAVLVPISNIFAVIIIFLLREGEQDAHLGRAIMAELARNPLMGAIILGGIVNLLSIPVPDFITGAANILGSAALPMLLLCVGASIRISALRAHSAALVLAVLAKLLVLPVIMMLVGLALGLDKDVLLVLVVLAVAPTATSSFTLAQELGGDAPLMAEIITVQTLVAAIGIPIWVLAMTHIL